MAVEDDAMFRQIIKACLEKGGYELFVAQDGEEAVVAIKEL